MITSGFFSSPLALSRAFGRGGRKKYRSPLASGEVAVAMGDFDSKGAPASADPLIFEEPMRPETIRALMWSFS